MGRVAVCGKSVFWAIELKRGDKKELRSTREIAKETVQKKNQSHEIVYELGFNPKLHKTGKATAQVSDQPLGGPYRTNSPTKTSLVSSDFI